MAALCRSHPRDAVLLFGARALRMFSYGALTVVLLLYLQSIGLSDLAMGTLLTGILVGDLVITLWLSTRADAFGRRRTLIIGAGLKLLAGVIFASTSNFFMLLLAGVVGVITTSGGEIGPFLAIEQAGLTEVYATSRVGMVATIFGYYNAIGYFSQSFGALFAGWIVQGLSGASAAAGDTNADTPAQPNNIGPQEGEWSPVAAYRVVILVYACIAAAKGFVYAWLSPSVECQPQASAVHPTTSAPAAAGATAPAVQTQTAKGEMGKERADAAPARSLSVPVDVAPPDDSETEHVTASSTSLDADGAKGPRSLDGAEIDGTRGRSGNSVQRADGDATRSAGLGVGTGSSVDEQLGGGQGEPEAQGVDEEEGAPLVAPAAEGASSGTHAPSSASATASASTSSTGNTTLFTRIVSRLPSFGLKRPSTKHIVARLCLLFATDAFAGGFVMQTMLIYWLHKRWGIDTGALGSAIAAANVLGGLSGIVASYLVGRIGAINTMVFTHLPSNILLILIPLMPTPGSAVGMLLLRFCLSQMDVPARQAYVATAVASDERSAAGGITNIVRSLGVALSPLPLGAMLAAPAQSWVFSAPFFIAGGLKIGYDLALYHSFKTGASASAGGSGS